MKGKRILTALILIFVWIVPFTVFADSEAPPFPYVAISNWGRCYFKMSPDSNDEYDREKGVGFAYKAKTGQFDELLWTTNGWYAYEVFLTSDGEFLVRMGNWPRGYEPSDDHLAVAFYKRGLLMKSYSTKDLIVDVSKVTPTVSHYSFIGDQPPGFDDWDDSVFRLVTVDGVDYRFDVITGEILSAEQIE